MHKRLFNIVAAGAFATQAGLFVWGAYNMAKAFDQKEWLMAGSGLLMMGCSVYLMDSIAKRIRKFNSQ